MLRIIGSLLIIGGCSGFGLRYRFELEEALRHLRKLRELLELLMSEINYHKSTLPEACRQVGMRMEEPYKSHMIKLHELLNEQSEMDFQSAWIQEMGECVEGLPISKKEKGLIMGIAGSSGLYDYRMQMRTIEQYRDMLDDSVRKRETEIQKQARLSIGLGVMGGFLLVLILL